MQSTHRSLRRLAPLALAALATLALAAPLLAQNANNKSRLPDIGSSAGEVLGPAQQAEYGAMTLSQLRHYGYMLDDPLLEDWLQSVGHQLAANSDKPRQSFTFFLLKDRQINAFATLGGYIGTNAGLVLAAQREDQVASVLAHEISHVTQGHVLRGVERAQTRQRADPARDARRDPRRAAGGRQFRATTRRWPRSPPARR